VELLKILRFTFRSLYHGSDFLIIFGETDREKLQEHQEGHMDPLYPYGKHTGIADVFKSDLRRSFFKRSSIWWHEFYLRSSGILYLCWISHLEIFQKVGNFSTKTSSFFSHNIRNDVSLCLRNHAPLLADLPQWWTLSEKYRIVSQMWESLAS